MLLTKTRWQTRRSDDLWEVPSRLKTSHVVLPGRLRICRWTAPAVAVDSGPLHNRGVRSYGWQGRRHASSAVAIHDAHLHSARNRRRLAVPLAWPAAWALCHQFEPSPANRTL